MGLKSKYSDEKCVSCTQNSDEKCVSDTQKSGKILLSNHLLPEFLYKSAVAWKTVLSCF